jgi:Tfp pilus assembly protein PilO
MQLKAKSDQLREAWNNETAPQGRLEKLRALVACLDERLKLMRVQLFDVQEAAAAIKPITTPSAMAATPEFWASISGDELSED